jgi:hypothetical protein
MGCTRGPELAGAVEKPHNDGRARAETRETTKHGHYSVRYSNFSGICCILPHDSRPHIKHADCNTQYATPLNPILGSEYFLMASELMNTTKVHEEHPRSIYISTAKSMKTAPPCFRPRPAVLSFSPQLGR